MSPSSPAGAAAGIFTTDRDLVVRSWDAWLAAATGIAEADALGQPLAALFPEVEARGHLARLRRVAGTGVVEVLAPAFHEYLLPCPPRAPSAHFARMQQHVTIAPVRDGGEVVGVVVTIEDVTAHRDRERELAGQLRSPDDAVRLRAVRALGAAQAPGPLVGTLGDRNWRVRRAVVEELARTPDDAVVDELVAAMRSRHRDPAVLNTALSALVRARHDVFPALAALVADAGADADLRTYLALAFGLLEDVRAVPILLRALDDADANVRFHAIEALGRIRSREAALPIVAVAETRDFSVGFAALDTLAMIGEPSIAPRLVALLDDELLLPAVVEALGQVGNEDVVAPLAMLLGQDDAPVGAVAVALATLHARLEAVNGEGAVVAALAREVVTPAGGRALLAWLPGAAEAERVPVVEVLGWLAVDGAEAAIARSLAHPDVRRPAADVLARRGAPAVPPLLDALAAEDLEVRKAAAAALGRIGAAEAVPVLLGALEDAPEVAVVAAGALGGIGDALAFEALLARLDDPHAAVRQAAVSALHSIGHPDTPQRVGTLLVDASPRVREAAARIAGYFGDATCLEPILALCLDPDESVRRTAVEQLAHFDDPRARDALAAAVGAGPPAVRAAAVRALAHGGGSDALPRLLAATDDPDPWVRYYAARSAGRLRAHGAVPALVRLATTDAVPPVRIAAVEALVEIGVDAGLSALAPLAEDPDPMVARPALAALGAASDPATLPPLLAALETDDRARRLVALGAVARRGAPEAVPEVAAVAATSDDPELWASAIDTLARIGGASAIAVLTDLAADPRRTPAVVDALARTAAHDVALLGRALGGAGVHVRCAIVEALGRMPHGAATALLAGALDDPAPAVRAAAAYALQGIDLRAARGTGAGRAPSRMPDA